MKSLKYISALILLNILGVNCVVAQNSNLLSSANGSSILSYSSTYTGEPTSQDYGVYNLLKSNEERKKEAEFGGFSVWSTETDVPLPHEVIFDLGHVKWVTQFNFNTNGYAEHENAYTGITPKNIEVWQKQEDGQAYSVITSISLQILSENQIFNIEPIEIRYLKFVIRSNHGNPSWTYIHFSAADDGRRPYDMASDLKEKRKLDLYGILFDFGKSTILPESETVIDEVAKFLIENPDQKIEIIGHTDNVGSEDANLQLSEERALAVCQDLIKRHSLNAAQISAIGKGESAPIANNDTSEERAKNRRVSIHLL